MASSTKTFAFGLIFAAACLAQKIDVEKLREDYQIFRTALEEGHSGIYRYTPKKDMDAAFDRAAARLTEPMTTVEFYRLLMPVAALVKCGHTSVGLPREIQTEIGNTTLLFPLDVAVLDRKIYVLRDHGTPDGAMAGGEILSINGLPAAKLLTEMFAATPGDGNIQTSRARRIGIRGGGFPILLYTLMGISGPYEVAWRDGAGKDRKSTLTGITGPQRRERVKPPQRGPDNGSLSFVDDGRIAVLKVDGFGGTVKGDPLSVFFTKSFQEMQEKKSRALIIDLRDNGGGNDALGKQLLAHLLDSPFQYYESLIVNALDFSFRKYTNQTRGFPEADFEKRPGGRYQFIKHPNWGTQQPAKPPFAGKVFVLINGASFSASCEFASNFHFRKRGVFIGEESGGGYYGNTSGGTAQVTLPNSKVITNVPLLTYTMAVSGYPQADRSVMPEHPVRYTIQDLIAGTDKEMPVALELARKP
jgi:hypothetical protein